MNGAESLVHTLLDGGVDVCFTNPGTSEMHFVSALDRIDGMRCVLGLFEGVVTGAADGYARMTGKPAATLLHLGPGLANGNANLHNAGRARTPVVNIVGDHTSYHRQHDAPLTSDVEGTARPFSKWVRTSRDANAVSRDGADAIVAARSPTAGVATLILPADTAWGEAVGPTEVPPPPARAIVDDKVITLAAEALRGPGPKLLFLGNAALLGDGLKYAARIAEATGAHLLAETFNPRFERGAGRLAVERLQYSISHALDTLGELSTIVLAGAKVPVAFFAHPGKPSVLLPQSCEVATLATPDEDIVQALAALADLIGARTDRKVEALEPPALPHGAITLPGLAAVIGALIPDQGIVVDESVTSGRGLFPATRNSRPHDWLQNVGGSIGFGMPAATGAAIACPDRKVLCLEADGCGMFTLQSLWSQAREGLDITTVIFANREYAILKQELANVGVPSPGPKALDLLNIGRPDLDWVGLARSMGVEAGRATTLEELADQLGRGLATPGPYLVELVM
ncbi:acetolactate synthase large subunit [Mesorhizobium sp. M0622]|uniref:acetolactate synthase large subunit n=1 Tax=unclassified Mesorhizobium TaxID=325217 RepID=UPI0033363426